MLFDAKLCYPSRKRTIQYPTRKTRYRTCNRVFQRKNMLLQRKNLSFSDRTFYPSQKHVVISPENGYFWNFKILDFGILKSGSIQFQFQKAINNLKIQLKILKRQSFPTVSKFEDDLIEIVGF